MSAVLEQQSPNDPSASPELASLRVLLVHQWLYAWAGAERCLEQLALLMPQADIVAGIITDDMRRQHPLARRAAETWVGALPRARSSHRWFLPAHALAMSRLDTSAYDLVISVSHAFEKAVRARKSGAVHVCYCLTPPRYLWDLSDAHDAMASPLQRLALGASRPLLRRLDRAAAAGVHRFITISHYVARRVEACYGRVSTVVYPPVAARETPVEPKRDGFLLSLGRLVPYKRVDLAIRAAEQLRVPLVVAGDGPERGRLERLAGPHTTFAGAVSEEEAGRLLSRCAAFVFCAEDDFGIAPVEANAHGAPVVAFARGGAAETMRDGETGVLFAAQTVDAVADAMRRCLGASWDGRTLRENAARFAPERFRAEMGDALVRAVHAA